MLKKYLYLVKRLSVSGNDRSVPPCLIVEGEGENYRGGSLLKWGRVGG